MPKASEITRELSGTITVGDNEISLTESEHKAILQALIVLLASPPNHSDAKSAGELVSEFISDVKVSDLENYWFKVSDNVKEMLASGKQIRFLALAYAMEVETTWMVDRGGARSGSKKEVKPLTSLLG